MMFPYTNVKPHKKIRTMIRKIEIKNFRSILKSTIDLQKLTVIVGANATGKSNLIKAVDFISDISEIGLQEAIYRRGGISEILPKQNRNIYDEEIEIKFEFEIEPPDFWLERKLPPLVVFYELAFLKTKRNTLKITRESINIKSILLLSYYLEKKLEDSIDKKIDIDNDTVIELSESSITVVRNNKNDLIHTLNFNFSEKNIAHYINWLGVKRFFNDPNKKSLKNIQALTRELLNVQKPGVKKGELVILSNNRAIFSFCVHFRQVLSEVQSYGRYDLLINELRQEQAISSDNRVSVTGDNLPSIIKKFAKDNKEEWNRIMSTMSNISPYFDSVKSESLRAGKEYLIFTEVFKGRNIESWESSDGTLRALAILISIESHKASSTVLIEEPEHGLHPWAVKELISHINNVIKEKHLQVILTTHSQQVLECIEENELLITERDESGTKYSTIKQLLPNSEITMGEIGELWTRGLLRGVPVSW